MTHAWLRVGFAPLVALLVGTPAWAHGDRAGRGPSSGARITVGSRLGGPGVTTSAPRFTDDRGLSYQDRIGRDFTSHHMVGGRFIAPPARIVADDPQWHGTTPFGTDRHCGSPWRSYYRDPHHVPRTYPYPFYPAYQFYPSSSYDPYPAPYPAAIPVVVPPRIIVTTPYFCGPCGIGFAGEGLFHDHVVIVHDVPGGAVESTLVDVDGRVVFAGY